MLLFWIIIGIYASCRCNLLGRFGPGPLCSPRLQWPSRTLQTRVLGSHVTEDGTAAGRRRHRLTIPPPPRATSPRPPLYVARLLPPLTARPPAHPPAPPPPPPLLLRRLRAPARNASTRRRTPLTPPLNSINPLNPNPTCPSISCRPSRRRVNGSRRPPTSPIRPLPPPRPRLPSPSGRWPSPRRRHQRGRGPDPGPGRRSCGCPGATRPPRGTALGSYQRPPRLPRGWQRSGTVLLLRSSRDSSRPPRALRWTTAPSPRPKSGPHSTPSSKMKNPIRRWELAGSSLLFNFVIVSFLHVVPSDWHDNANSLTEKSLRIHPVITKD